MQDGVLRNEKGQLLPGQTANPSGVNGHAKGWMKYGDRLQGWLQKPAGEVLALIDDQSRLNELSSIDAVCAQHVANMLRGKETGKQREKALDRIEGKARPPLEKSDMFNFL
ncbi:MAG: hypothetical protein PHD48_12115 [Alphaproteobacteria bacterium]|nr:hypothetical protein [Alphaproteobacteria bacterium]